MLKSLPFSFSPGGMVALLKRICLFIVGLTLSSGFIAAAQTKSTVGEALFRRIWIADIEGVDHPFDGLGPTFSARSCFECHGNLRVGRTVNLDQIAPSSLLTPTPDYSPTLHDRATIFFDPDVYFEAGDLIFHADDRRVEADQMARRVAPSLRVVPLIEGLSDNEILGAQDPDDEDSDGVRGVAHLDELGRPGRYGWKAEHSTLQGQVLAAFRQDMGLDPAELQLEMPVQIAEYLREQRIGATPRPPGAFTDLGCAVCHRENDGLYSNLLLHDLGPELADPFGADAALWRTAPLFDLADAFEQQSFMHDGRAKSVQEAILMHGGEGRRAAQNWANASPEIHTKIVKWLRVLSGFPGASYD